MSLKSKMFLSMGLVLLASVGCIGYGLYGSASIIEKANIVKSNTYPVLEKADELIALVKETKNGFIIAFEGEDEFLLDDIAEYEKQFVTLIEELKLLSDDDEIEDISRTYLEYIKTGKQIVSLYIETEDFSKISGSLNLIGTMAQNLNGQIKRFHELKYKSFDNALSDIERQSLDFKRLFLTIGIVLILIVLFIIVVIMGVFDSLSNLLFYAKELAEGNLDNKLEHERSDEIGVLSDTFEYMRVSLKELIDNLDAKVEEKTYQLQASEKEILDILNAIDQGIVTFCPDQHLNKEHSSKAEEIFCLSDFESSNLADLLKMDSDQATAFANWITMILKTPLALTHWTKYAKLCPVRELEGMGRSGDRAMMIQFRPILQNNTIQKFMLLATDITEKRRADAALEESMHHQANFTATVYTLINNDITEVGYFLQNTSELIKTLKTYSDLSDVKSNVTTLFREVHTQKGHAGTLGFLNLTKSIGHIESFIGAARASQEFQVKDWLEAIEALEISYRDIISVQNKLFHDFHVDGLLVDGVAYKTLLNRIRTDTAFDKPQIYSSLVALNGQPFEQYCKKYDNLLEKLRVESHKPVDSLIIETPNVVVHRDFMRLIDDLLVHLIRNAFDHGMEDKEERDQLSKPAGWIKLAYKLEDSRHVVRIEDNGRGIDFENITKEATERGIISLQERDSLTEEQKRHLIFMAGLSTKDQVSDLSGRGVGLDVVYSEMKEHGGEIIVDSVVGRGSVFQLVLPVKDGGMIG